MLQEIQVINANVRRARLAAKHPGRRGSCFSLGDCFLHLPLWLLVQTPSHPGRLPCRRLRAQRGIVGCKGWVFESQSKAEIELPDLTLERPQSSLSHKHAARAGSGLAADTVSAQRAKGDAVFIISPAECSRALPAEAPAFADCVSAEGALSWWCLTCFSEF